MSPRLKRHLWVQVARLEGPYHTARIQLGYRLGTADATVVATVYRILARACEMAPAVALSARGNVSYPYKEFSACIAWESTCGSEAEGYRLLQALIAAAENEGVGR